MRSSCARASGMENYCTPWSWVRYPNGTYAVYTCYSQPDQIPGAHLGLFNTVTYYQRYYWLGKNYFGQDVWRLFQSGTAGNPAGTAWPWTVT